MKVADKTVVSLDYSLHLGDGAVIDSSEGEPLTYLHGAGMIVPGLEKELAGMEAGQTKQVVVQPSEGYGERDPQAVQEVPMSAFGGKQVKAGDEFIATDQSNNQMPVRVESVLGDKVKVDFNHPLAGKTLHFNVTVKDVRNATKDELSHGHAHGPGHEH